MLICSENLNKKNVCRSRPPPISYGFVTALSIAIRTSRLRMPCTLWATRVGGMVFRLFTFKYHVRLTMTNLEDLPRIFEFGENRNLIRFVNLSRPHTGRKNRQRVAILTKTTKRILSRH